MSAEMCTTEQAIAACSYLNNSFGGYPMTIEERRPYVQCFLGFSKDEVKAAIDKLTRGWTLPRRPAPNDISKVIHEMHKPGTKRPDGPYIEEQPVPDDFDERMAEVRAKVGKR